MHRSKDLTDMPLMVRLTGFLLLAMAFVISAPAPAKAATITHCDIQAGPCIAKIGDGMTVEFDVQPKPVKAMTENTFVVTLSRDGQPLKDASIKLDLSMPNMYMGKNQPVLRHVRDGRYEGKGIITRCASGSSTWQAEVVIESAGKTVVATFIFEVK
jgi:hypothetical protein